MMFQGAYTNEFYRALHDALHAQVDSWNSGTSPDAVSDRHLEAKPDELWRRVMRLEKTCRNPKPTVLRGVPEQHLARLEAPVYATSFDELLNVLSS